MDGRYWERYETALNIRLNNWIGDYENSMMSDECPLHVCLKSINIKVLDFS